MEAYCVKIRNEYEDGYYQLGRKAGVKEGVHGITQAVLNGALDKSAEMRDYLEGLRKTGMREVVEWIEERIHYEQGYDWGFRQGAPVYIAEIDPLDLQRLKERCKPNSKTEKGGRQ